MYSKVYLLTLSTILFSIMLVGGCSNPNDFTLDTGERGSQVAIDRDLIVSEDARLATIESLRLQDRVLSSEISLKFTDGVSDEVIESILKEYNLVVENHLPEIGFYRLRLAKGANLTGKLSELWDNENIEIAEPIFTLTANQLRVRPNDPRFNEQGYLDVIKAPEAWFIQPGSDLTAIPQQSDVVVAVLDSGMDMMHPDLMISVGDFDGMKILSGWNFVNGDNDVMDEHGHGTLVTGIIGALTSNAVGISGVGWNPRILPVKIIDNNGMTDSFKSAEALLFALGRFNDLRGEDQNYSFPLQTIFNDPFNAKMVINMSYSYNVPNSLGPSQAEASAINICVQTQHVMMVAAAGDDGISINDGVTSVYPANHKDVISVGSVDYALNSLATTNKPSMQIPLDIQPFVVAPGYNILSTFPTHFSEGYGVGNGTSFSAAQVTGMISLIWSQFPYLRPSEVFDIIKDSSDHDAVGASGIDSTTGWGLIDCFAALQRSYQPKPINEPLVVTAFTNPILHGDIIFVVRSKFKLMSAIETPYYIDELTGFPVLINDGKAISYNLGYDTTNDGVIDTDFPIVRTTINGLPYYHPNEIAFIQFSDDLYVGRIHFSQDSPPMMGTFVIQFTGVPMNFRDSDEIPRTVTGETSIEITGFHYS